MDNKNNKLSPMEEIMRITREAKTPGTSAPKPEAPVAPKPAAASSQPQRPAVTPTQVPAQSQRPAANPTQAPVQPQISATNPTQTPVQPQRPVTNPTQAPAQPQRSATNPTQTPVQPQRPAANPTQAPVQPQRSATNPTQTPVQPQRPVTNPTQAPAQPQRPAANPTAASVQPRRPASPKPTAAPTQAQRPASAPRPQASSGDSLTRADKVRMARENAVKAREDSQKTRVMNVTEITPEQLEKQKEEARILVQKNQSRKGKFATRETKIVKPRPEPKKNSEKKSKHSSSGGFEETVGRGVLSNAVKVVIYIVAVLVISGCLSLFAILVGNDCFAFVKNDVEATISLSADADLNDIAKELKKNDIIEYPNMFKLYINIRKKDTGNYVAGNHTVNSSMGYDQLIAQFKPTSGREEITLTIVEGSSTQEIIDLFVENGIGTQEGFEETIKNYEFDFWFLEELDKIDTSNRIYRLDGYLFPDTYNFFTDCSEADALYKLLSNFEAKFDIENKARVEELGMSVDDIVIMASLIQKEAMYISDYPLVSSVFHNRLDIDMKLESNATVQYTMPKEEVELKLTNNQIMKYDNGYNTYLYSGLPEGPICNPSLNALNWALYPNDTDYLYFVSDMDGFNHYAKNWAEHDRNVKTYQGG